MTPEVFQALVGALNIAVLIGVIKGTRALSRIEFKVDLMWLDYLKMHSSAIHLPPAEVNDDGN